MSPQPVARAEIVVDLAAIRHNVRALRELTGVASMTVVKADGYGHGMVEVGPRRPRGRLRVAGRRDDRRGARPAGGRRRGPDPLLADRAGRRLGRGDRRGRRRHRLHRRRARRDRGDRPPGPRPAQGRHRPVPRRRPPGRLARGRRPRPRRRGGRQLAGHRHLVPLRAPATSPTTPRTTPRSRPSATRSPSPRRPGCAPRCGTSPTPRPASCARRAASTWSASGWRRTASTPRPATRPTSGLVPAMTVRAPLAMAKPIPAGAGVSYGHTWVADTATTVGLVPVGYGDGVLRAGEQRRPRAGRRQAAGDPRPGLHGPVRRRPRRRPARARAPRSCCSAPAPTASRPPRTGRTPPAPSPTRSSPGSVAGWPGGTSTHEHPRTGIAPPSPVPSASPPPAPPARASRTGAGRSPAATPGPLRRSGRCGPRAADRDRRRRHPAVRRGRRGRGAEVAAAPGQAAADRGLLRTATRSTWTAGTSSASTTASRGSGRSSTTSARTAGPAGRRWGTPPSTTSAPTCSPCSTRSPPRGRSCWSGTRWAG